MKNKYNWISDLDADELRNALEDCMEENDILKRKILSGDQKSHVELIKNTKGVNVGVKAYDEDVIKASSLAETEFDKLSDKYEEKEN